MKGMIDWLDERIRIRTSEGLRRRPIPGGASWFYVTRASLLFIFTLQMATGSPCSRCYYVRDAGPWHTPACSSSRTRRPSGALSGAASLGRELHDGPRGAAHAARLRLRFVQEAPRDRVADRHRADRPGRRIRLYRLSSAWDQKAYWATVVGTNVAGTVPVVGGTLLRIVRGGTELGALSLSRFFAIHTYILPWSLLSWRGMHIFLLERAGAGGIWNAADRVPYKTEAALPLSDLPG